MANMCAYLCMYVSKSENDYRVKRASSFQEAGKGILEVKRPGKSLGLRMQSQTARSERQNPAVEVKVRN